MKQKDCLSLIAFVIMLFSTVDAYSQVAKNALYRMPSEMYGNFFYDVMNCDSLFSKEGLFVDSKAFLDIEPKGDLDQILNAYGKLPHKGYSTLAKFITDNFNISKEDIRIDRRYNDIDEYIGALWKLLQHKPESEKGGTLIPLKYTYFVPGGRFREIYYWDSYFSMLGMACDNEITLIENMVNNFSSVIDDLGFIPNGNRSYYLGRSQPPFFCQMVELLSEVKGDEGIYIKYLPEMQKEYDFWMRGAENLSSSQRAILHTVMMPDGAILNRYYDAYSTPREEMYRNDIETGKELKANHQATEIGNLYRNLRAAAESGYDFSSRWMADGKGRYTTHTTDIVPVDLNSLLYKNECILSHAYLTKGDLEKSREFDLLAKERKEVINKYLWNKEKGYYFDYLWTNDSLSTVYSLAGVMPLFCHVADSGKAKRARTIIMNTFLRPGGLVTTPYHTGEQWDAPNGWAPLQWIAYKGFRDYGFWKEAQVIKERWMDTCESEFRKSGVLFEKYNVEGSDISHGGEYQNQVGFGWSNGVYRAMKCNWQIR